MKKLFFIALSVALCTTALSQIYIQAGINLSKITTNQPSETQKNTSLTTFNAGILDRFRIVGPLDFETGLSIEGKGSKSKVNLSNEDNYTVNFNPFYLEVPANLVYRFSFPKKTKLFVDAGPYVAMALAGQSKLNGDIGGVNLSAKTDIQFSNSTTTNPFDQAYSHLKRFDYGVNFGAGLDFRTLLFKLDYGMGLAQVNSGQIDLASNDKNKFRTASISFGIPLSDF
ncbi:MAG TPA: porin family protein [Hanamia sp.]|nr:porin family protein [Hanamia sp.]